MSCPVCNGYPGCPSCTPEPRMITCPACNGTGEIFTDLIMTNAMNDKDKQHRSEEFQELTSKIDRLEKIALLGAKNVLTIDDVALITGFTKGHIYRLTSGQKIPHYKPNGRTLYFKKEEIEDWMLQNKIRTNTEIESAATTYTAINKKK